MSPDSSRLMLQTDTVIHETPPSGWTEAQKCEYLLDINQRENPRAVERLRSMIEIGYFADEIAALCDEYGHLVYINRDDPNALVRRFDFVNIEHPSFQEREKTATTSFDENFYLPLVASIHRTRELVALASKNADIVRGRTHLRTHEDYMGYFSSFPKSILDCIISNLAHIEITRGCNGPCRSVCCLMPESRATEHMPYATVLWLIDRYMALNPGCLPPMLYYANDMADYYDSGKTAIDVVKYIRARYHVGVALSTAYSLSSTTINFLYGCLKAQQTCRISRLATGNRPGDFDRLWKKIENRAMQDGVTLSENDRSKIESGFNVGTKIQINTMAGGSIKRDTEEREMSTRMFACRHGVLIKTGEGFQGIIMRPTSRRFPTQQQSFPIVPGDEIFTIPLLQYKGLSDGFFRPLTFDWAFVAAPTLLKLRRDGTQLSSTSLSPGQKRLYQLTTLKRWINTMWNKRETIDPRKFCHIVRERIQLWHMKLHKELEDDLEGLCELELCLVHLIYILEIQKKHASPDDVVQLHVTMRFVAGLLRVSRDEMSLEQILEKWHRDGSFHELNQLRESIGAPDLVGGPFGEW